MSPPHDSARPLAFGATIPDFYRGDASAHELPTAPPATGAIHGRPSITRNGKIARLPWTVRKVLNRRLEDGAQGKSLVAWLNGLAEVREVREVREVMNAAFGGRGVTEQNLSEWRQGGFLDWQRQQEAMAWVRQAAEETEELGEVAGPLPLTEVLGASITLLLSRLIRDMAEVQEISREQRRDLMLMIRQWCVLRSGDHRAAKLKMHQQDWTTHRTRAEAARKRWGREQATEAQAVNPATAVQPQALRVNPAESDRIAPKKGVEMKKAQRASGGRSPRLAGEPARPLLHPGHKRAASRPAGKMAGDAAIKPQPRKGGRVTSRGLASPESSRRSQKVLS